MKNFLFSSFLLLALAAMVISCKDDVIADPNQPTGTFTSQRTGTFVAQNGTASAGTAQIGTDENGDQFVKLGSDFTSTFATGTLTIYLSKGATYMADPGNGNPTLRLLGVVRAGGEQYFKVTTPVTSDFNYVILWCGSASIPFGNAPLN